MVVVLNSLAMSDNANTLIAESSKLRDATHTRFTVRPKLRTT